jgi:hypothetical protein
MGCNARDERKSVVERSLKPIKGIDCSIYKRGGKLFVPRRTCKKCGSIGKVHKHHITYSPTKLVVLCVRCHKLITTINTIGAIVTHTKQDNVLRLKLWQWFIDADKVNLNGITDFLQIRYEFSSADITYIINAAKRVS